MFGTVLRVLPRAIDLVGEHALRVVPVSCLVPLTIVLESRRLIECFICVLKISTFFTIIRIRFNPLLYNFKNTLIKHEIGYLNNRHFLRQGAPQSLFILIHFMISSDNGRINIPIQR